MLQLAPHLGKLQHSPGLPYEFRGYSKYFPSPILNVSCYITCRRVRHVTTGVTGGGGDGELSSGALFWGGTLGDFFT